MKNLILIAIAIGVFPIINNKAKAQTSVNVESLTDKATPKISLKFIDNIEITPEKISNTMPADEAVDKNMVGPVNMAPAHFSGGNIEQCSKLQFKYAMLMDREVETFTNTTLYSFIDEWWATRYRYGGTDKNGIDCSAFTGKVLATVYGVTAPRTATDQYNLAQKIDVENLVEGDLVFFNTRGGVSHVGVYLGGNYFVHSSVSNGVTISNLTDDYYSRKFIGGGRIAR